MAENISGIYKDENSRKLLAYTKLLKYHCLRYYVRLKVKFAFEPSRLKPVIMPGFCSNKLDRM